MCQEILLVCSLLYFIYASVCAYDHYHMGFRDQMLRDKERDRLEVLAFAGQSQEKILSEKAQRQGLLPSTDQTQLLDTSKTLDQSNNNTTMLGANP